MTPPRSSGGVGGTSPASFAGGIGIGGRDGLIGSSVMTDFIFFGFGGTAEYHDDILYRGAICVLVGVVAFDSTIGKGVAKTFLNEDGT